MVNFANYTGSYTLAIANSADGANISGGSSLNFDNTHINFSGSSSMTGTGVSNGYGSSFISGFLAGPAASHAGAVYEVQYTSSNSLVNPNGSSTTILGAAVYKQH